jgi:hypothetical protein
MRHTVEELARTLFGHRGLIPVHFSAGSQIPLPGRHSSVEGASWSAGQFELLPEQNSAGSQMPADARHRSVLGLNVQEPAAEQTSQAAPQALLQQTPFPMAF